MMETPIIAALIAAAVSLASTLVTLYLAKKSTQRAIELSFKEKALEQQQKSEQDLNAYIIQIELYPIRLWNFEELFTNLPTASIIKNQELISTLTGYMKQYNSDSKNYLEAWANVKPNMPEIFLNRLRKERHETRGMIDTIKTAMTIIERRLRYLKESHDFASQDILADINYINELWDELLTSLDREFSILNQYRFQLQELGFTKREYKTQLPLPENIKTIQRSPPTNSNK